MAKANPFRWSTRYQDDETDIVMYPCRPYRDGRFLSRDPIEEEGGDNLYGFVNNNPVNATDPLGLVIDTHCDPIDDYLNSLGISFQRTGSYRYTFSGTDLGTGAGEGPNLAGYLQEASALVEHCELVSELEVDATAMEEETCKFAIGIGKNLAAFAEQIGAKHLVGAAADKWEDLFCEATKNPDLEIHINLDGLAGSSAFEKIVSAGNSLGWEFQQLFERGLMGATKLYENGVVVDNPFAFMP